MCGVGETGGGEMETTVLEQNFTKRLFNKHLYGYPWLYIGGLT